VKRTGRKRHGKSADENRQLVFVPYQLEHLVTVLPLALVVFGSIVCADEPSEELGDELAPLCYHLV
jgi:hypothetical protein